jgi:hypothetical protein
MPLYSLHRQQAGGSCDGHLLIVLLSKKPCVHEVDLLMLIYDTVGNLRTSLNEISVVVVIRAVQLQQYMCHLVNACRYEHIAHPYKGPVFEKTPTSPTNS